MPPLIYSVKKMATNTEQQQPTRRKLVPVSNWGQEPPQQPAQPQPQAQPQAQPQQPAQPQAQPAPQPQAQPQALPAPSTPSTPSTPTTQQPATTIPDKYKQSTYDKDWLQILEEQMALNKPMSQEELEKLRKRQRAKSIAAGISDAVRAVANLIFTNQYAPNMYDPNNTMSKKLQERFDKEKAEREAQNDKFFQYAMTLGKLRGEDRDREYNMWKDEQNMAREERNYQEAVAFRNKQWNDQLDQWKQTFERQGKWHDEEVQRLKYQFEESVRQFNVTDQLERQRLSMQAQSLALDIQQNQVTWNLGGNENVTLSLDKLNATNIGRLFNLLPEDVRNSIGEPMVDEKGLTVYDTNKQLVRKTPSLEAMLIAIGANAATNTNLQKAIRGLAGVTKPDGY